MSSKVLAIPAKRRLEELISEVDVPQRESRRTVTGSLRMDRKANTPSPGTTLVRDWHGRRIEVRVLESGFEWDGTVYRSLSAIAKKITNAHWNGKLFFGLVSRKRKA